MRIRWADANISLAQIRHCTIRCRIFANDGEHHAHHHRAHKVDAQLVMILGYTIWHLHCYGIMSLGLTPIILLVFRSSEGCCITGIASRYRHQIRARHACRSRLEGSWLSHHGRTLLENWREDCLPIRLLVDCAAIEAVPGLSRRCMRNCD